ncbi:MAG TPA: PKD domain-containing protein [Bacteroidales bacterium]|nr:PKD domain-containing protein [Bacteroidales bacterium]
MKKIKIQRKYFWSALLFVCLFSLIGFQSCRKEEVFEDPIATFQFEVSPANWRMIIFTNFSSNAVSYLWDFGDARTSTEENPVHTYAGAGTFEVTLTATNGAGVTATHTKTVEVTDPYVAIRLLAGETSKTWRLYRVGTSLGVGPNPAQDRSWWALSNDGSRPCVYYQEFTFNRQGGFIFDDKGSFWGEEAVFAAPMEGTCFAAIPANMVNQDGADVRAWLSGTHAYTYDPVNNRITLTGMGAWMGLPQLGTTAESIVPTPSRTFNAVIEQHVGFDLLTISYTYANLHWSFTYASYSNPALEPPVATIPVPWGVNLPDVAPTQMFLTFESRLPAAMALIDTVSSGSTVAFGVEDPLNPTGPRVGRFNRTAGVQWQELQIRTALPRRDIQFTNFTTAKVDIFIPADTDFNLLQRHIVIGFADVSQTQQWWQSPVQFVYTGDAVTVGSWATYTIDLTTAKARTDLDMIYVGIGGGGHTNGGTFFIRNLRFE